MDYKSWCHEVDEIMVRFIGLDRDSVEDYLWYDAFESGLTPLQAFMEWKLENVD